MKDVILSLDFETYGKIPGVHSLASIGVVAYQNYREIDSFYAVFEELSWTKRDPDTMQWWKKQPEAWQEIQKDREDPQIVMDRFYDWATALPGTPKSRVFAANPSTFDMGFLTFYCYRFLGDKKSNDISYRLRCLDIRSYFAAIAGIDYSQAERYKMPREWFGGLEITHSALDDARNQGVCLCNMLAYSAGIDLTQKA